MKFKTTYTLQSEVIDSIRNILQPWQFDALMSMAKISYDGGADYMINKYSKELSCDEKEMTFIFNNLNCGNFAILVKYPTLITNKDIIQELLQMYGVGVLEYVDGLFWKNYEFVNYVLDNYSKLDATSCKIYHGYQRYYKLDDVIAKIDISLFNEVTITKLIEIPLFKDIDKLMQRLNKECPEKYVTNLLRIFAEHGCVRNYTEQNKNYILSKLGQLQFKVLNNISAKLWQQNSFVQLVLYELELISKINFCIPQIYLEKVTCLSITHKSIDRSIAVRLIALQPKLLAFMINSPIMNKELILLALQRDHTLVNLLRIDLAMFNEDELLRLVSANGLLVQYLAENYKQNDQFVYAALNQNPLALEFVDIKYQDNDKLVLECILRNTACYEFISPRLKQSTDVAEETVKSNSYAVYLLDENVRKQLNLTDDAILGNNINHATNFTPDLPINTH